MEFSTKFEEVFTKYKVFQQMLESKDHFFDLVRADHQTPEELKYMCKHLKSRIINMQHVTEKISFVMTHTRNMFETHLEMQ